MDLRFEIELEGAAGVPDSKGLGVIVSGRFAVSFDENKETVPVECGIYIKSIDENGAAYRVCSFPCCFRIQISHFPKNFANLKTCDHWRPARRNASPIMVPCRA